MPLTFSAGIEAEVEAAETGVIDLIEVDLGLGFKKFWSTTNVAIDWVVTEFGSAFEPRLIAIGDKSWTLGLDSDTLNLQIGNADGAISRIAKEFGIDIFEGAQVKHHRLFTSIKEIYRDYWTGTGLPMVWTEDVCSWDIEFGVASFRQKFGRKIEFSCPHIFAAGAFSDCPYDLFTGTGSPEKKVFKTTTAGTTTSKIFVSGGGLDAVSVGWVVLNRNTNAYYRVTNLVSDTEIDVSFIITGEGGSNSLLSGHKLWIGPPYQSCNKSPAECKERDMWGKYSTLATFGTKKRYFGGAAAASKVRFSGRLPNPQERFGHGSADRFTRTSLGNDTLEGTVIPVIVGNYRINDIPSTYILPAGAFQHGLFILCEGEIRNFTVQNVNGFRIDNVPQLNTLNDKIQHDSFIKWGVWYKLSTTGVNDDRVGTNPAIAFQVRGAIGQRRGIGIKSRNSILDTYGTGTVGNPSIFNNRHGDGTSQHGLVVARIRIETQEDIQSTLTGDFDIEGGLLIPLPDGMDANTEDLPGYSFVGLAGPIAIMRYSPWPNPIQVAHELLRNQRWGAGISADKIDIASVIDTSNFCEEHIQSIESAGATVTGTVGESSAESPGSPTNAWVFLNNIFERSGSMIGLHITFNKGTDKAFDAIIVNNDLHDEQVYDDYCDYGCDYYVNDVQSGNQVTLDRPFIAGKEPVEGDSFDMLRGRFVKRFKANGIMADDIPIPDMLESVLENCNGTFRNINGKIGFLIRRKLSATEIDTVISDGIFTDRGVKRNILRTGKGKKSTMRVWREDEKTLGNFFTVEFRDQDRKFQESRVAVFNDAAQHKAAKLFGDLEGRLKIPDGVKLILTTTKDQAARLLTLKAREIFIQNLFVEFSTSLKRGMKAIVGDIIAVDSETIAAHFNVQLLANDVAIGNSFLFRILEKSETSAYTIRFKCQVHVNPIYEGHATDFTQFFTADEAQRERNSLPAPVTPLAAEERVIINSDGSPKSVITVKVTYPDLSIP